MRRWYELGLVLVLMLMTEALFWDGHLDVSAARYFYHPDWQETSPWAEQGFWLWQALYNLAEPLAWLSATLALIYLAISYFWPKQFTARKAALYIFLLIILGPALLINGLLKENWGRPRPREIAALGGSLPYQPPLQISGHGRKSFVCGHCGSAFVFFGCYFLAHRRRSWILLSVLGFGFLMGWVRMAAGAHFLSDILWSGYLMFLLSWLLHFCLWPKPKSF